MSRTKIAPIETADPRDRAKILKRAVPSDAPEVVPARMINEVIYCERLLYLEWAQGEFQDNVFTVDGRIVHRRVDGAGDALPQPADDDDDEREEPPPFTARSVWLTSERLGLTAKIDLIEGADGLVVPVEYKRGHAPDVKAGAHLPERAQVCAQVLLLREHGHRCEHAEIWFAADRRRVRIEIDDWLIDETLRAAARAREIASSGDIPPPLEDSPKCKGCSLVGVCMPEEVGLLRALDGGPIDVEPLPEPEQLAFGFASDANGPMVADPWQLGAEIDPEPAREVRRLVPPRDVGLPLYLQAQGTRLTLVGERLRVETSGEKAIQARIAHTSHVAVFGNVQVTTQAIGALLDRGVPLVFFSSGGWFRGRTVGHASKNIELRIAQPCSARQTSPFVDNGPALLLEFIPPTPSIHTQNPRADRRRPTGGRRLRRPPTRVFVDADDRHAVVREDVHRIDTGRRSRALHGDQPAWIPGRASSFRHSTPQSGRSPQTRITAVQPSARPNRHEARKEDPARSGSASTPSPTS